MLLIGGIKLLVFFASYFLGPHMGRNLDTEYGLIFDYTRQNRTIKFDREEVHQGDH
jgi:hypothetical protein